MRTNLTTPCYLELSPGGDRCSNGIRKIRQGKNAAYTRVKEDTK